MHQYTNTPPLTTMTTSPVVVLGDYYCDFILTGLQELPRLGAYIFGTGLEIAAGGAFITTVALHRLGVPAEWVADLGNDLISQFILAEARREGLNESRFLQHDFPLRKLSFSFSFPHDRGFISYIEPQPPTWVINPPFDGSPETIAFIQAMRARGSRIFLDTQYLDFTLERPGIIEIMGLVDIFAQNESEALQLTGAENVESAAAILAQHTPFVLIKRGGQGAIARSGGQTWTAPALPVTVIDTTGAGDCFNAGFMAAHLRGESVETCLRYGNICGGLSTTRPGGANAAPTLAQLQSLLPQEEGNS